jgi:hypothetical protein
VTEVELLFAPGEGRFTGRAECNVLVAGASRAGRLEGSFWLPARRRPHLILCDGATSRLNGRANVLVTQDVQELFAAIT